ncbi:cupin domain-containing protein [Roseiconus lacunae]|uniref:cupin domain-containing protein n=1 Tax=Roseiconus lacunae TaxID=2605694 RepID=UPI0011F1C132|nr:cupin domain-containing protein [Roseiconus lacunae]
MIKTLQLALSACLLSIATVPFGDGPQVHGQDAPLVTAKPDEVASPPKSARTKMPVVKVLRSDPVSCESNGKSMSASLIEVTFAPLAFSPPHRHPGEVAGYVLEGTLEFKIEGKTQQVLRAGDTFFEPAMILHEVARNPDPEKRCRILVTMIHPRDAQQLTIPERELTNSGEVDDRGAIAKAAAPTVPPQSPPETCTINLGDSSNRSEFDESLPTIGVLLFDSVLMTEVTAPIDVFSKPDEQGSRQFNVVTVAKSYQPIAMESGLRVLPDYSFEDCPELDVLVVSSSYDMETIVASSDIVEFVRSKGKNTKFTMSNCAGAHLIGASGLANGRKIVTYIGGGELLQTHYPELRVQDDSRVSFVIDGKMVSSNGNLASYISALELLETMTGKGHREFVESQLYLERLKNYER